MVEILEHMSALSDPTRCRMLLMLEKHELTVSELCAVLQMPQSSVSRQLKTLADDNWVASRCAPPSHRAAPPPPGRGGPLLHDAARRPRLRGEPALAFDS